MNDRILFADRLLELPPSPVMAKIAMNSTPHRKEAQRLEVRFESLFLDGRAVAFPCDAAGYVDMDRLSERGRCDYLFARAMVGREYAIPCVRAV